MEKLSISISPEEWGSLITKYRSDSRQVTLADFTDGTVNVDTDVAGSLTKRKGGPNYNATLLAAAPKDQYEAIFSDGARHLLVVQSGEVKYSSGDTIFNTIVNGTGYSAGANFEFATTQDRVYGGNSVNAPIVYDRNTSYGGVTYTAPRIKTMGVQAPGSAPTAGAPTAGGAVPAGAHTYKVTFLYYDAEESNGSPASGVQTAGAGNFTIPLTAVPIGGYGVTARKIYRDNNDGLYLHVGTISNNTATTFSDTLIVGVTPTEIPEFNNAPPTFGLITTWLDKQWLAKVPGDPSTLFYTETTQPDIVRPENQIFCNQEDPITAFIVYFGRLIVFNRRSMGQILGSTPDTFRYSAIPSSIGCVDNRTLQIRVIQGVPLLVWLSDRGFYSYDGNAINYISDEIEDLVNFNIQQAVQQKNSNTQSSQAQFTSGTSSNGIDLLSNPGAITTKGYVEGTSAVGTNPRRNFDDNGDWNAGTQVLNIQNRRTDNLLSAIIQQYYLSSFPGTRTGDMVAGTGNLSLTTTADFTGGGLPAASGGGFTNFDKDALCQPITFPRAGTITSYTARWNEGFNNVFPATMQYEVFLCTDSGGNPNFSNKVHTTGLLTSPNTPATEVTSFTASVSIPAAVGQRFWICVYRTFTGVNLRNPVIFRTRALSGSNYTESAKFRDFASGNFVTAGATTTMDSQIVFSPTPIPRSGQYTSTVYDTLSDVVNSMTTFLAGVFPSSFGVKTFTVELQDSADNSGFTTRQTFTSRSNFTTATSIPLGRRYFRYKVTMATTDDRETDTITQIKETYAAAPEWISAVIDMSSDVTVYNSLVTTGSTPTGTSLTTLISTSSDNISYSSFVAFGSHTVRRYAKIKIVFNKNVADTSTPTLTSIVFTWTVVSNLISSIIDTAVTPPAGWDIFLASYTLNGGTVQFQMRSSASAGTIGAATFFTVTPTDFPTLVTPLQFTQWKVIITSTDTHVPVVDSVTVQWLISNVPSLRPASIFVDSRYYVALAALNTTFNTVLLELDLNGKWRRHRGQNISTFSYFFNRPYFGVATTGQVRKFLEGLTDAGTAVEFDVRFKATDFSTKYEDHSSNVKLVGEAILQGTNTGATYQVFYSVDLGETFYPLYTSSGSASYVSATDGQNFYVRFRPIWDGNTPIAGRTIMYRIYSNDAFEVEVSSLDASAFLRAQAPVITG